MQQSKTVQWKRGSDPLQITRPFGHSQRSNRPLVDQSNCQYTICQHSGRNRPTQGTAFRVNNVTLRLSGEPNHTSTGHKIYTPNRNTAKCWHVP